MKKFLKLIIAGLTLVVLTIQSPTVIIAAQNDATDSKIEEIQKKGELVLGTSADYPPYEFHEQINGVDTIVGFDIEIAKKIAEEFGVSLRIEEMSFDGLLAALQSGSIDLVIAGMSATPERAKSVDFSDPYYKAKNIMLIHEDNAAKFTKLDDFTGTKIGAQQGSIQEEAALKISDVEVRSIGNLLSIVTEVKQKTVDGMVIEDTISGSVIEQNKELVPVEISEWDEDGKGSSVAVQKGNPVYLERINNVIDELISSGEDKKIYAAAKDLADNGPQDNGEELSYFQKYGPMIAKGTLVTIGIALLGVVFGSILGLLISLAKMSSNKVLSFLATAYIELVRGTPMLIQIYIIFYALPPLGIKLPPFYAGTIAVSLNSAAYVAEIFRAGINAVNKGQMEAGMSLGLPKSTIMKKIIVPQAITNILPALGNEFVTIIKESSIVSIIGVADLMYAANTVRGNTFQPFKPLIIATIIYFVLTFTLSNVIKFFEGKLNKNVTSK